jgi:hypothetical protein
MTRKNDKQQTGGRTEVPPTIEMFPKTVSTPESAGDERVAANGGEPQPSEPPKAKTGRRRRTKPDGIGAKSGEPIEPLPDKAKPAQEAPKTAQQDAAAAFMKATAHSQAFATASAGLLGAVRLGLPDSEVHFKVKPIEEVTNPNGTKEYRNTAIVSLFKLPDGARINMSEPRMWLIHEDLVPAFKERKAKIYQYQLRLAVDRQGTPYLIPVPVGARDIWGTSLATVVKEAEKQWVKMYSDPKKGRLHDPGDDQKLEPQWPREEFAAIYMLALMPVYVQDKDHDIYKRVCGA